MNKILEFRYRIKCKAIHLILGNHDDEIRKDLNNVRQIFSSVSDYKEVEIMETSKEQGVKAIKTLVCLMHYPIRSWRNMRKGSIMLHGHCHGNLPDLLINGKKVRTMDVGFDTHEEFRPYSWQEVRDIMEGRSILTEDHH